MSDKLTPSQTAVLELLAAGNPPKKAAMILGIERGAVINRLFAAKAKMGARTTFQAVAMFAVEKLKAQI